MLSTAIYIFSAVLCGNGLTTASYDDLQISQASSPFHTMFFTPWLSVGINLQVQDLNFTGITGIFMRLNLGRHTSEPKPSTSEKKYKHKLPMP